MLTNVTLHDVTTAEELNMLRTLLHEYAVHLNRSAGGEHICMESYEQELTSLPGLYAPPRGALLLAFVESEPAGCVALRPLEPLHPADSSEIACEMKRLWVRPQFRGAQLGRRLVSALLDRAAVQGYTAIYLDTIPTQMQAAMRLYDALGFQPTERYRARELFAHLGEQAPEVVFLRRSLVSTNAT